MDSLLNEMKLNFKRGQKIKYIASGGEHRTGTYVMASSVEGYVVLDRGNGQPIVVPLNKIIKQKKKKEIDLAQLIVDELRKIK